MSKTVWVDKCFRCQGERDRRTMLYEGKKTNAAGTYRGLETKINESGIVKLQSRPLHARLCLPCLKDLSTWLKNKNARVVAN